MFTGSMTFRDSVDFGLSAHLSKVPAKIQPEQTVCPTLSRGLQIKLNKHVNDDTEGVSDPRAPIRG